MKEFIVAKIPVNWENILRKKKKLTVFANYFYRDAIPEKWKCRENRISFSKNTKTRLITLINLNNFLACFNYSNTIEGKDFWIEVNKEIVESKK